MIASGGNGGGTVDLSEVRSDIASLQKSLSENTQNINSLATDLTTLEKTVGGNKTEVQKYQTDTDATIESIENNVAALEEEVHEPEILNAPIEIEGAFPQVLPAVYQEAKIDEMYVWTYFVPGAGREDMYPKQAGMEHLQDLMTKLLMKHETLKEMSDKITDLESKYNTLYQACVTNGIIS